MVGYDDEDKYLVAFSKGSSSNKVSF